MPSSPTAKRAAEKQSDMPGFVLERTAKRMKQFFQQTLSAAGTDITIDQWVVLQVLNQQEGLSQLDIARATFKDAPTITRIIDLLCQKSLTQRVLDPTDRRRFRIRLTREGKSKIEEVLPIIKNARQKAWNGLNKEQMRQLMGTLNMIFDNLSPEETK